MNATTVKKHVTVLIPAAGQSSRFQGGNKLLQAFDGDPVIAKTVLQARRTPVAEVVVVTGADSRHVAHALVDSGARLVFNPDFARGMSSTIVRGVRAIDESHDILIWPGDMPLIDPKVAARIIALGGSKTIVTPSFNGRRGHPVYFGNRFRKDLLRLTGDRGARSVLEDHPGAVMEWPSKDEAVIMDIDAPVDLKAAETFLRQRPNHPA